MRCSSRGLIPARAGRTKRSSAAMRCSRAHPRSRGADDDAAPVGVSEMGSSPLARGGRAPPAMGDGKRGLIPARAGRTGPACADLRRSGAHPRSRGADDRPLSAGHPSRGSSPLARGGRADHLGPDRAEGLIPARAGRTSVRWSRGRRRWAHPRSRGADTLSEPANAPVGGSSPLARGGHYVVREAVAAQGLIPARAGRTDPRFAKVFWEGAHPRSRGADQRASSRH